MDKLQKSQLAKVAVVALLLLVTPLLSASMRSSYLYLLFNVIIIALGVESGILSGFSQLPDGQKPVGVAATSELAPSTNSRTSSSLDRSPASSDDDGSRTVEKPTSLVKKSPSKPSLFFVGGGDLEEEDAEEEGAGEEEEEAEEEEVEVLSRQELFVKAETFIGNFYHQLKIQREESWKKIHGLYHGAF